MNRLSLLCMGIFISHVCTCCFVCLSCIPCCCHGLRLVTGKGKRDQKPPHTGYSLARWRGVTEKAARRYFEGREPIDYILFQFTYTLPSPLFFPKQHNFLKPGLYFFFLLYKSGWGNLSQNRAKGTRVCCATRKCNGVSETGE